MFDLNMDAGVLTRWVEAVLNGNDNGLHHAFGPDDESAVHSEFDQAGGPSSLNRRNSPSDLRVSLGGSA